MLSSGNGKSASHLSFSVAGDYICLENTRLEAAFTGSQDDCLHEVAARFPACQSGRHPAANCNGETLHQSLPQPEFCLAFRSCLAQAPLMFAAKTCAAVIPCFNEAKTIAPLVAAVSQYLPWVIVVDDGSTDDTAVLAGGAGAVVVSHKHNRGKGAALQTGLSQALKLGFEWAMTLDGDGQHAPDDLSAFQQCAGQTGALLVVGNRMHDARTIPWLRRQVNRWMSRRLSRLAGRRLPDTQCGFRLIHLKTWSALPLKTEHFEVESETLMAFLAAGCQVEFVPIQVIRSGRSSHIQPLTDSVRWWQWWRNLKHPLPQPALAARLRAETVKTVKWAAEGLRLGAPGYVNHLSSRRRKAGKDEA